MRGNGDRGIPVAAVFQVARILAIDHFRERNDGTGQPGRVIILGQRAIYGGGVNQCGIVRVESNMSTFATARVKIIFYSDSPVVTLTGDRDGGVVLLAAVDPERRLIVSGDTVKLRGGLVHDAGPGLAAVKGHGCATVVGVDHVPVIVRVDPVIVVVAVWRGHFFPGLAAVDRLHHRHVQHVDGVRVHRVCRNVNVVPGARVQNTVTVDQRPFFATVVAAPQTTLFRLGLDDGVDAVRVAGRHVHADLANHFR